MLATDLLATDLSLALDPALIMSALGLVPDPWQEEVLRSGHEDLLLLCCRQGGKSTATAALATHTAIYEPGSLILCLSPSQRQSGELFRKVKQFYQALPHPLPLKQETILTMELINGSRIVALPGQEQTIRGYSGARLLLVDEASRVEDALYYAIRPMLAVSGGRLIGLSTPFGARGWFHEEWTNGATEGAPGGWKRFQITAHDCPRISPAFLEAERIRLGDYWFSQEYLCEFRDTTDQVFSYDSVMSAMSSDVKPLFG